MTVMASWFCFKVIREKENNFTGLNNCQCSPATVPILWVSHLHKPKDQWAGQCQVVERSSCSTSRKMTSLSSLQPAPRPPWPAPDGAHFSWCQTIDPYGMVTTNQWHSGDCTCCECRRGQQDFIVTNVVLWRLGLSGVSVYIYLGRLLLQYLGEDW